MNAEQRIAIERKIVRHLIRSAKKEGWWIERIDDGGEPDEDIITPNETEAMEAVFAVDECTIYFTKKPTESAHAVRIILGNDGNDCICDYTYDINDSDGFKALMDRVGEYAEISIDGVIRQIVRELDKEEEA